MMELKCFPVNSQADPAEPKESSGLDETEPNPEADLLEKWLKLAEAALKNKTEKDTQPTD